MKKDDKKTPMLVFDRSTINDLIEINGLNVLSFSQLIGTSHQLVKSWIVGPGVPKTGSLLKIVNTFHLPMDHFFVESDVLIHRYHATRKEDG